MREGATSLDQREVACTGIGILDGATGEDDTIADLAVACNLRTIAKHAVIADHNIVADMSSFEQEVLVADLGDAITVGTTVDDYILADDIVVANLHIRLGSTEIEILRQRSYHTTLMDLIILSYTRPVADADEGEDDTIVADHHIVLDIHEGEYLTVIAYFRLWRDFGLWTDFTCHNSYVLVCTTTKGLVQVNYCLHFIELISYLGNLSIEQVALGRDHLKIRGVAR